MLLHEFQAKALLRGVGIQAPMGDVAASATEAQRVAERHGCGRYAVKAQLLTNDRQRIDAIRFAETPADVAEQARRMIGTAFAVAGGDSGEQVAHRVLVEEFIKGTAELYAAVTLDEARGRLVMLASKQGGADIEARARTAPKIMHSVELTLEDGRLKGDFAGLAKRVAPTPAQELALGDLFKSLAVACVLNDALFVEINPLVVADDGQLVAVDAKMRIDTNAMFRHPELASTRAQNERLEDGDASLEAQRFHINFMPLDGNIGVAVNGAGLALATNDLLVNAGGRPANFMDIRTTASSLDIAQGLEILLRDGKTKALFVNVHGGGMQRCDTIAEGLGIALRRVPREIPIVMRLAGNNAEFARTVLRNNGVQFHEAASMRQGAERVVALAA